MAVTPTSRLEPDRLRRYFSRIGYDGPVEATPRVLAAIHRAHLLAIPYENIDIHLGRPITLEPDAMFRKLVDEGRGGWCYEMNGVLGRVLDTMGFDTRFVAGAVGLAERGESARDNHLVIVVTLDQPWLVDVGFGDGFLEPLPLLPGVYRQGFLEYRLSREGDGWRLDNHAFGGADGFDFTLAPRALVSFARRCHDLQTAPESSFVRTTVCERHEPAGLVMLRAATLRTVTAAGVATETVTDAEAYDRVLRDRFGLRIPGARAVWPRVQAMHRAWLAQQASARG